jgi:hypothetical protein
VQVDRGPQLGGLAPPQVYSALIQPTCFLQVKVVLVVPQLSPTVASVCWRSVALELAVSRRQPEPSGLAKQVPF